MIAWIGMGANQGDRERFIRNAIETLDARPGFRFLAASGVYQTPPFGPVAQGPFLNAAAAFETDLEPAELLRALKAIEVYLGRRESVRWGPREIDLDILLYGNLQKSSPELAIPHAGLCERPFALIPLAEAARNLAALLSAANPAGEPSKAKHTSEALETAARADAWLEQWRAAARGDSEKAKHGQIEKVESEPLNPKRGVWRVLPLLSPAATESLGGRLARACRGGEIFALGGSLGAGKTCLTRGIARGLGIRQPIQSPTFNLCRTYDGALLRLHHWDFYRMVNPGDLDTAGFDDTIVDPGAVTAVEWAGKFPERWDFSHFRIKLEAASADECDEIAEQRRIARVRFPKSRLEPAWEAVIDVALSASAPKPKPTPQPKSSAESSQSENPGDAARTIRQRISDRREITNC